MRAFRISSDDSGNHRWRILVELAGVEPASEIPTYHLYYNENSYLSFKTVCYYYLVFAGFKRF